VSSGWCIEQFELLGRWDVPVALPEEMTEEAQDNYAMYATIEAYEAEYGPAEEYPIVSILDVLKLARDHEAGITIHGVVDFAVEFDWEDVKKLEPQLSAVIALVEALQEEISIAELVEKIGDTPVIFLGEYPDVEKGGSFGVHAVKHVKEAYEMIPVFLNEESAQEYNGANHPMTWTTINELQRFYDRFGILVEPQKKYWAEIRPESE